MPSAKIAQAVRLAQLNKMATGANHPKRSTPLNKMAICAKNRDIHNVSHIQNNFTNVLYQICTNGSAPLNKTANRTKNRNT